MHPVDWRALPGGRVWLELRCPECLLWTAGAFPQERVRALQCAIAQGRAELAALHARAVRDNMYRELDSLRRALELDLIGADDFALRPVR